ncbi:helix-turn-helix domain-containing protein [Gorillibacterium timonense]|uniref:helix-turn-helix domain-containing protein n=1 Tax=Gorillibacterium timonense TaxID=1689269 RepID=UPI00071DDDB6|nr:helix-turn-helix transcriptional regulator [Gorillibacterium timonense]
MTTNHFEYPAQSIAFMFIPFVMNGKAGKVFSKVMEDARSAVGKYDDLTEAEREHVMNVTVGRLMQGLSIAYKTTFTCCGAHVEARGIHNKNTGIYSLLVRCNNCGNYVRLSETGSMEKCERHEMRMKEVTLRSARQLAGLSESEAAKALRVTIKQLRKWERHPDKMRYSTALRFRKLYGRPFAGIRFCWLHKEKRGTGFSPLVGKDGIAVTA